MLSKHNKISHFTKLWVTPPSQYIWGDIVQSNNNLSTCKKHELECNQTSLQHYWKTGTPIPLASEGRQFSTEILHLAKQPQHMKTNEFLHI
jgi:hypothetical protein